MRWKVGLTGKYSEKLAYVQENIKFSDWLYYVDWRIATDFPKDHSIFVF